MTEEAKAQAAVPTLATPPKPELVTGTRVQPIVPRTVEEAFRVAQAVIAAGLAPDTYQDDPQKVLIGIMSGAEVGLPPMQALKGIAIINGRPSIWGDAAIALVQQSGKLENSREWFEPVQPDAESPTEWGEELTACCALKRRGQEDPYIGRFSVRDAKRAKLWMNPKKGPWMQYPQRMLMWRARTYAIRDGFADCLAGLSIAEEVRDLPAPQVETDTDFLDNEPPQPVETSAAIAAYADTPPADDEDRPEAQEQEELL